MFYSFLIAASLLHLSAFAQEKAEVKLDPKSPAIEKVVVPFHLRAPLGRAIVQKGSKDRVYFGYFCLVMEANAQGELACTKSQFGRGRDLRLGVDFMGNKSDALGSWTPVGPVFDKKSGDEFYVSTLNGRSATEFEDIWKTVWARDGFNWAEHPVEIRQSKIESFIALLEGFETADGGSSQANAQPTNVNAQKCFLLMPNSDFSVAWWSEVVREFGYIPIFKWQDASPNGAYVPHFVLAPSGSDVSIYSSSSTSTTGAKLLSTYRAIGGFGSNVPEYFQKVREAFRGLGDCSKMRARAAEFNK